MGAIKTHFHIIRRSTLFLCVLTNLLNVACSRILLAELIGPAQQPGSVQTGSTLPDAPLPPASPTSLLSPSFCQLGSVLPTKFAEALAIVQGGGGQTINAATIQQLSGIDGDVSAIAMDIPAGISSIHGSLQVLASTMGPVSGIDQDLCAAVAIFQGSVQNVHGRVKLASLNTGGATFLSEITGVGSIESENIEIGGIHDVQGSVAIINGGTISEIHNVGGDIHLENTVVQWLHDVSAGTVYLKNSQLVAFDGNTVKSIVVVP